MVLCFFGRVRYEKYHNSCICCAIYDPTLTSTDDFSPQKMFTVLHINSLTNHWQWCHVSSVVYKTSNSDPHATNCRLMSENSFDSMKISFWQRLICKIRNLIFLPFISWGSRKTACDRCLQAFQGYFEDYIFIKKIRGQVCDGDVDVVDKCDEGDGDGRMMR